MDFKVREIRAAQGPKKPLRERETYFQLMQQGFSNNQACLIVGGNSKTRRRWRNGRNRPQPEGGSTGSTGAAAFWCFAVLENNRVLRPLLNTALLAPTRLAWRLPPGAGRSFLPDPCDEFCTSRNSSWLWAQDRLCVPRVHLRPSEPQDDLIEDRCEVRTEQVRHLMVQLSNTGNEGCGQRHMVRLQIVRKVRAPYPPAIGDKRRAAGCVPVNLTREDIDSCLHGVRELMTYIQILHNFRFIRFARRLHLGPQRSRSQLARVTEVIEEAEQPQHAHPSQPLLESTSEASIRRPEVRRSHQCIRRSRPAA
ncbi:hypothetical protein [Streptomyces sp. C10]|uniref:hypothetical protein n=1 Tax=Streptomyces sp. C10 TaxID=531941 RepID=UPI00397F45A4